MATGDLTTSANVTNYKALPAVLDAPTAAELPRLITAASELIRTLTSRNLYQRTYTSEFYDGEEATKLGTKLYLREYPLISLTSVKENGNALSFGEGYQASADVVFIKRSATLVRNAYSGGIYPPGGCNAWARGVQNIEVTYSAGYAVIPFDLEQACIELVCLLIAERPRIGEGGKNFGGWNMNYIRKLNPSIAAGLAAD